MKEVLLNLNETEMVLLYDCMRKVIKALEKSEQKVELAADLAKIMEKVEQLMEAEKIFAEDKMPELKEL